MKLYRSPLWIHSVHQRSPQLLANLPLICHCTAVFHPFKALHGSFLAGSGLHLFVNVSARCCASMSFLRARHTSQGMFSLIAYVIGTSAQGNSAISPIGTRTTSRSGLYVTPTCSAPVATSREGIDRLKKGTMCNCCGVCVHASTSPVITRSRQDNDANF